MKNCNRHKKCAKPFPTECVYEGGAKSYQMGSSSIICNSFSDNEAAFMWLR